MIIFFIAVALIVAYYVSTEPDFLGGVMSGKLSADQIAQVAKNAGFQDQDLITAVAIALAESGGDPKVVGDQSITPGGSVGLWQINLHFHPEDSGIDLTDPQANANAAYSIYQDAGSSFLPWSTFKNGAYTSHLDVATTASQGVNA